ncbi:MAG: hypothetical protein J0I57_16875 [Hyphomicrobium sp.]|nr:hypothetical protein [Hyphomicrobium sp.]
MSARPFDIPAAFARMWVDSSLQMMRATTELWTSLLDNAPARTSTSTASPWWMAPQQSRSIAPFGVWPAYWPQATVLPAMPLASDALFPWLPKTQTAAGNPFAVWQQMWLQAAVQPAQWPWQPAAQAATTPDVWQPIATAYRTANGHAMAAVLRTMADVVEPKPRVLTPADYWPLPLGTRH